MDKISLNIQVLKGRRQEEERYYVSGEINELGNYVVMQVDGRIVVLWKRL